MPPSLVTASAASAARSQEQPRQRRGSSHGEATALPPARTVRRGLHLHQGWPFGARVAPEAVGAVGEQVWPLKQQRRPTHKLLAKHTSLTWDPQLPRKGSNGHAAVRSSHRLEHGARLKGARCSCLRLEAFLSRARDAAAPRRRTKNSVPASELEQRCAYFRQEEWLQLLREATARDARQSRSGTPELSVWPNLGNSRLQPAPSLPRRRRRATPTPLLSSGTPTVDRRHLPSAVLFGCLQKARRGSAAGPSGTTTPASRLATAIRCMKVRHIVATSMSTFCFRILVNSGNLQHLY